MQTTLRPAKESWILRTVVRARIGEKIKEKAATVPDTIGLTVSDAFRLMMARITTEKRLSFDPLVPNEETVAAMQAAERGELITVGDIDGLMADLNADDQVDGGLHARLQARDEGPLHPERTGGFGDFSQSP